MGQRLAEKLKDQGIGVMLQEPGIDKYKFEGSPKIDCENRVHLCKAACCRLKFALSRQDLEEGVVKWDLARPYLIRRGADGYCNHLQSGSRGCGVYENSSVPGRAFDCRNDKRIWLDFDKRIPNPAVSRPDWLEYVAQEAEEGKRIKRNPAYEQDGQSQEERQKGRGIGRHLATADHGWDHVVGAVQKRDRRGHRRPAWKHIGGSGFAHG